MFAAASSSFSLCFFSHFPLTILYYSPLSLSLGMCTSYRTEYALPRNTTEYICHGSWMENGTTFIIARHAGTKHGVCISFKPSLTDSTAAQLIIGDSCYRETMLSEIPEHHLVSNVSGIVRKYRITHSFPSTTKAQPFDVCRELSTFARIIEHRNGLSYSMRWWWWRQCRCVLMTPKTTNKRQQHAISRF